MPTRQYNQRRSPLLHRLAREHKGTWRHSPSLRGLYRPDWSCRSRWPRSSCGSSARKAILDDSLSSPPPHLFDAIGGMCGSFSLINPSMSISLDMRADTYVLVSDHSIHRQVESPAIHKMMVKYCAQFFVPYLKRGHFGKRKRPSQACACRQEDRAHCVRRNS